MKVYKSRASYRRKISKLPFADRKAFRQTTQKPLAKTGKRTSWSKLQRRFKKVGKSKTVRTGLLTSAAVGTVLLALPKETIAGIADTVQELAESAVELAENTTGTASTILRTAGNVTDSFSNVLAFVSENLVTVLAVSSFAFLVNKVV